MMARSSVSLDFLIRFRLILSLLSPLILNAFPYLFSIDFHVMVFLLILKRARLYICSKGDLYIAKQNTYTHIYV